ncbi:MAG: hypothetical protein Q4G37_06035, partial [Bifidobacterium sp.]|nr:hypothetical protein [Bifidobacterium sp.]
SPLHIATSRLALPRIVCLSPLARFAVGADWTGWRRGIESSGITSGGIRPGELQGAISFS